jgi:predicted AlkP superfamily phosphohydrolase/phosphomutase
MKKSAVKMRMIGRLLCRAQSVEFRRIDKRSSNVGGNVAVLGEDGEDNMESVIRPNEIGSSARGAAKLLLADTTNLVFTVSPNYTQETAVLRVERGKELEREAVP